MLVLFVTEEKTFPEELPRARVNIQSTECLLVSVCQFHLYAARFIWKNYYMAIIYVFS